MTERVRVTETLDIDLDAGRWTCNRCGQDIGDAEHSYKEGLLVAERDPEEVHPRRAPEGSAYSFAPDPEWCRVLEFYCPGCAVLVEVEYLPPGHPITRDLVFDLASLRASAGR
ncbi:acetone carboxylase subunit gamma [Agromyces sp. NPDC049794]|uniref:acetone carboxylase subunit gamma n=1 Tax=unclassified Agromyces TaxID=2639701 RepID=UPI0033E236F2